jgi:hypothetical protein
MLEMVVFALVLVIAQIAGGFIMLNILMSEKFMGYYMKKTMKIMGSTESYYEDLFKDED